jgi:biofilm protein TabA
LSGDGFKSCPSATKPINQNMNIKPVCRLLIAAISFMVMENTAIAQRSANTKAAQKWMEDGAWKNGLKLNVHPSTNAVEFYAQYQKNKAVWDKVFSFLKETNLDTLSVGRHVVDGDNAYVSVTEAPSRELDKAGWESHKKYIDLQYVIKGKEQIGVAAIDKATVTKPYDEGKDVANYTTDGTYYTAEPGTFFLFFALDAHRPNIKVTGFDVVKKLVVKIKAVN